MESLKIYWIPNQLNIFFLDTLRLCYFCICGFFKPVNMSAGRVTDFGLEGELSEPSSNLEWICCVYLRTNELEKRHRQITFLLSYGIINLLLVYLRDVLFWLPLYFSLSYTFWSQYQLNESHAKLNCLCLFF